MKQSQAMIEYMEEFDNILRIRARGSKTYGDDWVNDPIDPKVWLIWEKAKRATIMLKEKDLKNDYEKMEDTLVDLVNYAIFSLVILKRMRGKYV